jgi:hypothetical protein
MRFYHNYTYEPLQFTMDKYKKFKWNYKSIYSLFICTGLLINSFFVINYYGHYVKGLNYFD